MDKNYDELIEALKSHSERNKNFITALKSLKQPKSSYFSWVPKRPDFSSLKLWDKKPSNPDLKQLEVSSNADSIQLDQNEEEITVHEIIQDIKEKIVVLEEETKQAVIKISQYYISATSKKEEVQFPVVQVYERDGNTSDFVTAFQESMEVRCIADVIKDVSKIDVRKPLLILCQTRSRLIPDIDYSLELFTELENASRLGIVVIHSKDEHALPTTSSDYKLGNEERFKSVWIIDTAFTNDSKFYDCKMNNEAIVKLQNFLKEDTSV